MSLEGLEGIQYPPRRIKARHIQLSAYLLHHTKLDKAGTSNIGGLCWNSASADTDSPANSEHLGDSKVGKTFFD